MEAGSITYSAVIHPPGLSTANHGGTSGDIDAVHSTIVLPCCHNTDPAGVSVNRLVMFTGRNWSLARPSLRMTEVLSASGPLLANG